MTTLRIYCSLVKMKLIEDFLYLFLRIDASILSHVHVTSLDKGFCDFSSKELNKMIKNRITFFLKS
ncbi:hypothetical protein BpHYR1_003910 [Brachionus plicatilis]|uniref:Uncharacterized protein n=1 Tax=Brachionus plicatilis TaxID=10195 RepID=A0A3M7PVJ4_BRAPC|nr:hypothetical protein BpHYR1_003910 [Brachionus plicatilis]